MADKHRKIDTIRRIENLLLDTHFIQALEDQHAAEAIVEAVDCLEKLGHQWN